MKTTKVRCDTNHNFVHPVGMLRPVADAGKRIFTRTQRTLMKKSIHVSYCFPAESDTFDNNIKVCSEGKQSLTSLSYMAEIGVGMPHIASQQFPSEHHRQINNKCEMAVNRRTHLVFACLLLMFTLTPTFTLTAFAVEVSTYATLQAACSPGGFGDISLIADITDGVTQPTIARDLTLDLNSQSAIARDCDLTLDLNGQPTIARDLTLDLNGQPAITRDLTFDLNGRNHTIDLDAMTGTNANGIKTASGGTLTFMDSNPLILIPPFLGLLYFKSSLKIK